MLRPGPVAFLSLSVALILVGVAGAANSASFRDPAGDSGVAPDVTKVSITSDDSGILTFKVTLANRPTLRFADDVYVNLDLGQNPDTGSVWYGTEAALGLEGNGGQGGENKGANTTLFLRPYAANRFLTSATPPASLQASFNNGVATFSVSASDLGLSPAGGLNVSVHASHGSSIEDAPDMRAVNYQLVPGTASPRRSVPTGALPMTWPFLLVASAGM